MVQKFPSEIFVHLFELVWDFILGFVQCFVIRENYSSILLLLVPIRVQIIVKGRHSAFHDIFTINYKSSGFGFSKSRLNHTSLHLACQYFPLIHSFHYLILYHIRKDFYSLFFAKDKTMLFYIRNRGGIGDISAIFTKRGFDFLALAAL